MNITDYAMYDPKFAASFAVKTIIEDTGTTANALDVLANNKNVPQVVDWLVIASAERELTRDERWKVCMAVLDWDKERTNWAAARTIRGMFNQAWGVDFNA